MGYPRPGIEFLHRESTGSTGSSGQNPFLFIVGCPRSGTTLVKRIVQAHSHIAVTPETHWVPRWYRKRKGLSPEGLVTPTLVAQVLQYHKFPNLEIPPERVESLIHPGESVSYREFVSRLYDLYGETQGKPRVGDKTPGYVRSLPVLHELWPRARFIHVVRDGRDVCLSATGWSKAGKIAARFPVWVAEPVAAAAVWWEWHVRLGLQEGTRLGSGLYYEIRYEALVANAAEECSRLCAFLGVPYEEKMLRFYEGRTRHEPGLDAKHAWLPITPGLRDWRTQMSRENLEWFEGAAGGLLHELGYRRGIPEPSAEAVERAAKVREAFTGSVRAEGEPLPARWCPD